MEPSEVFCVRPAAGDAAARALLPVRYFKNMVPEVRIALGPGRVFFHQEEYEFLYLEKGHSPFSRKKDPSLEADEGTSDEGTSDAGTSDAGGGRGGRGPGTKERTRAGGRGPALLDDGGGGSKPRGDRARGRPARDAAAADRRGRSEPRGRGRERGGSGVASAGGPGDRGRGGSGRGGSDRRGRGSAERGSAERRDSGDANSMSISFDEGAGGALDRGPRGGRRRRQDVK
jgi:hypothetical protein